jgi:hypothetical protein
MKVDTDEFLKSLKSLQASPCECSAKNPDSDYPNQHTKASPRFQTMHCWCPPPTGPGQPHKSDCSHYKRPEPSKLSGPFFGHGLTYGFMSKTYTSKLNQQQAQAYAAALEWLEKGDVTPIHDEVTYTEGDACAGPDAGPDPDEPEDPEPGPKPDGLPCVERLGYTAMKPSLKPFLRIGKYYHAQASDPISDSPMRLARNADGRYYWTATRAGEHLWCCALYTTRLGKARRDPVFVGTRKRYTDVQRTGFSRQSEGAVKTYKLHVHVGCVTR